MNQFPLYPYDIDPFRILSLRRIREECPATPPDPPPTPETAPEPDPPPPEEEDFRFLRGQHAPIPDCSYWPDHPGSRERNPPLQGEGNHPQDGGGAPSENPAADQRESPEDERIRLMRAWIDKHWDLVEAMARADEPPQRPPPPPPAEPPEPPEPPPPVHVRRGDRWNKPKMVDFLRQLAATHSVAAAARSVGMSRNSAYRLRNRLKGQPFDVAWEAAFRHGYDNLAHAALDRALNGVEVPHYCNGELIGTSRRYDERLTIALLASRNRVGAPMLGRFGAAAEYWGENWDQLLERVGTGPVDWSDERQALGEDERKRLELPDAERDLARLIARNTPDDREGGVQK